MKTTEACLYLSHISHFIISLHELCNTVFADKAQIFHNRGTIARCTVENAEV